MRKICNWCLLSILLLLAGCSNGSYEIQQMGACAPPIFVGLSVSNKIMKKDKEINVKLLYGHNVSDQELIKDFSTGWTQTLRFFITLYNDNDRQETLAYEQVLDNFFENKDNFVEVHTKGTLWTLATFTQSINISLNFDEYKTEDGKMELKLERYGASDPKIELQSCYATITMHFKIYRNSVSFFSR